MRGANSRPGRRSPMSVGIVGVICGLAGVAAWFGYASFAGRSIDALARRVSRDEIQRLVRYSGYFSLAQLLLGILAIGSGWIARNAGRGAKWAGAPAFVRTGLGVLALILMLLIV